MTIVTVLCDDNSDSCDSHVTNVRWSCDYHVTSPWPSSCSLRHPVQEGYPPLVSEWPPYWRGGMDGWRQVQ